MKSTAMKLIILGLAVSLLLTLWIGSALAASYDLWVGGVQVTDSNKANILGDGTAQYDPSTATLTLGLVLLGLLGLGGYTVIRHRK